jgi:hypothetical protein
MKSSIRKTRYFRPSGRKVAMALAFASLISGLSISPAIAAGDNGYNRGDRHADHNQQRAWRGDRGDRGGYGYRPEYRRPYNYEQPVYVPPPVYYEPREPRQSPGINFFFPLDLRR